MQPLRPVVAHRVRSYKEADASSIGWRQPDPPFRHAGNNAKQLALPPVHRSSERVLNTGVTAITHEHFTLS